MEIKINSSDQKIVLNGITWIQPSACTFGDYVGSGSVGLANIKYLKDNFRYTRIAMTGLQKWFEEDSIWVDSFLPEKEQQTQMKKLIKERDEILTDNQVILGQGEYYYTCAWIKCNSPEIIDLINGLYHYPVFDDEYVSEVEMIWEYEAWGSYARRDLISFLPEDIQDKIECEHYTISLSEHPHDQLLFECYRQAMAELNQYPIPEYNGSHIPIDRIQDLFVTLVKEKFN